MSSILNRGLIGLVTMVTAAGSLALSSPAVGQARGGGQDRAGQQNANQNANQDNGQQQQRGRRGGFGGGDFGGFGGGGLQPYFLERDIPLFVSHLDLDSSQKTIVDVLMMGYHAEFEAARNSQAEQFQSLRPQLSDEERQAQRDERRQQGQQFREVSRELRDVMQSLQDVQESGNASANIIASLQSRADSLRAEVNEMSSTLFNREQFAQQMNDFAAITAEFSELARQLEEQFVSDVKTILIDDQHVKWEAFEKFMRREKTMNRGRLSGESVDLFHIFRDLNIDVLAGTDVDIVLRDYADSVDRALKRRNEFQEKSQTRIGEAMRAQDNDAAADIMSEETKLRVRVRDANRRYAEDLALILADADQTQGAEFAEEFNKRGWRRVYRAMPTQRAFEAALNLEGLPADALASVQELFEAYAAELESHNSSLKRVIIDKEPEQQSGWGRGMGNWGRGGRGNRQENPINEAYDRRDKMDENYRELLESVLPPEMIAQLPAKRDPNARGFGRGGFNLEDNEQIMTEFDKDKNGTLSEEERNAAMQSFRDRFRRGRDGNNGGDGAGGNGGNAGGAGGAGGGGRGGRGGGGGN